MSKQDFKCFCCKHFIGCTEAGDVRCNKEKLRCLNVRDYLTVVHCKKNNWYQES